MGEKIYITRRPDSLYNETLHSINKTPTTVINKSYYFLLPLTGLSINNKLIENTYLFYKNIEEFKYNYIYVLLKDTDIKLNCGEEIERGLYKVPILDKFPNEYELFMSGEYSKFSLDAKMTICKDEANNNMPIAETTSFSILNKLPNRRKYIEDLIGQPLPDNAEVCSIYNECGEIYGGEKI